jgi:hypothetical protein
LVFGVPFRLNDEDFGIQPEVSPATLGVAGVPGPKPF